MRSLWIVCLVVMPGVASAQSLVDPPDGLREVAREVDVTLRDGMALVTTRVELRSDGPAPVEAVVHVPTPGNAGLAGLEVCSGDRCGVGVATAVDGVYEAARTGRRASEAPVGIASLVDGRDPRVRVEAAPVLPERPFVVTVRYLASAALVDGVVTFALPTTRASVDGVPTTVSVSAPGLEDPTIDGAAGPRVVPEGAAATLRARVPEGAARASAWSVRCGDDRCSRLRVVTGPVRPTPRDVVLLLDASPSARGADPHVRARAIEALMAALAPGSRVLRVAFARRAVALDAAPVAPEDVRADEPLPALGNQTSFVAAWGAVREHVRAAHDPLVVLLGDGALPSDAATGLALRELTDAGAELSLVTLAADRRVDAALELAIRRSLGVSELVAREAELPRVARLATPIVAAHVWLDRDDHGPLRAGEERVFETRHPGGGPVPVLSAFGRRVRPAAPRRRWADGFATRMGPDHRATLVVASPDQIEAARKGRTPTWGAGFTPRLQRRLPRIITCRWGCGCSLRGA